MPSPIRHALGALLAALGLSQASAAELTAGQAAPEFTLPDQTGQAQRLADYRGRWVVLYFYPKDDTPGCTKEACNFRDDISGLRALGAQVLGVSIDSSASHAAFAKKFSLPFPLLADTDGAVARAYGSLWSLGPVKFARRHTFVIDPEGKVAQVYRDVDADTHARDVRAALQTLQAARRP